MSVAMHRNMPSRSSTSKQKTWERQQAALRDPVEILGQSYAQSGLSAESLKLSMDAGFKKILRSLDITLFVTREYEHLAVALSPERTTIRQSFVHLPHPSGLVVDRRSGSVYIAATRNPNQVWEFRPVQNRLPRTDVAKSDLAALRVLMPVRTKVLAGAYYLHDLALIGGKLYGNSVGQNAVVQIDMDRIDPPKIVWSPRCLDKKSGAHGCNYLQLNSIAAGATLEKSFFSASGAKPGTHRPGHPAYPVDGQGVIFSGATREVSGHGLTRPHSARLAKGKVWVDNSGYGEFGYIKGDVFKSIAKLPGWTRGLCIQGDVAFVGVSQVLPRFHQYAPGVDPSKAECGIYVLSLKTGKILGRCNWPQGNQIFAIDWLPRKTSSGFPFTRLEPSSDLLKELFYQYLA